MRAFKSLILKGLLAPIICVVIGCGGGDQIPLANVPPPPPIDPALLKSKVKAPGGASPSELVYPAGK